MPEKVIDLKEENGVYVVDEVNAVPTKQVHARSQVKQAPRVKVTIHNHMRTTRKPTQERSPISEFMDGFRESLSLLDHIVKRMR